MHTKVTRTTFLASTVLAGTAACLFGAMPAAAQAPGSAAADGRQIPDKIEMVTVTAMKEGAQKIQDVPASIAVLSGADLETRGVVQFSDFAATVAGLNYVDNGPGDKTYIIRGINSAGESQVAVYYDNVPTTGIGGAASLFGGTQPDLGLYDMQQIEVLRGPQGTLYGSNSQSGAILYVTNKPDASKFDASGQVDLSSTQDGGANYGARGMINIPLVTDKLALRVVGYRETDSGYIDNPLRAINGVNDFNNEGARASLKWTIDDKTTLLGQYFYQDVHSGGRSIERPYGETLFGSVNFPADGWRKASEYALEPRKDRSSVYALTFQHDFDWSDLTISASDYKRSLVDVEDYSTSFQFFKFLKGIGAFPTPLTIPDGGELVAPERSDLKAGEARLHTKFSGPINGILGVYYSDRTIDYLNDVYATNPLTGRPDRSIDVSSRSFADHTKEFAVYGEATWDVTSRLSVTGGIRWFDTKRSLDSVTRVAFFDLGSPGITPTQKSDNSNEIFKGLISYKLSPSAMVYAEYAEGYRAGGTNTPPSTTAVVMPLQYDPDQTADYEVGAKTSWLNDRLTANIALYWINLENLQVPETFGPGGAFSGIGNVTGTVAASKGVELDVTAVPADGLKLTFAGSYTEAELTKDLSSISSLGSAAVKGAALLDVPKVNLSITGDYSFPLYGDYVGDIGGVVTYKGDVKYHTYDSYNLPTPAYTLVNLHLGVVWSNYEATLYANNVFDENAQLNVFNDVNDAHIVFTNQPRTVGLRLSAHW